jgi:hypothetical protein
MLLFMDPTTSLQWQSQRVSNKALRYLPPAMTVPLIR